MQGTSVPTVVQSQRNFSTAVEDLKKYIFARQNSIFTASVCKLRLFVCG